MIPLLTYIPFPTFTINSSAAYICSCRWQTLADSKSDTSWWSLPVKSQDTLYLISVCHVSSTWLRTLLLLWGDCSPEARRNSISLLSDASSECCVIIRWLPERTFSAQGKYFLLSAALWWYAAVIHATSGWHWHSLFPVYMYFSFQQCTVYLYTGNTALHCFLFRWGYDRKMY